MSTRNAAPRRHRAIRRAPAPDQTIAQIRSRLEEPSLFEQLRDLRLRQGVPLDLLKLKLAEHLVDLVNHSQHFRREQLYRQDCARQARALQQSSLLRRSDRTRDLWVQIRTEYKALRRRARGIESRGQPAVIQYFRQMPTDRGHVYRHTLVCLFAILRHVTMPVRSRRIFFGIIACVLQAVGVLGQDAEDASAAIERAFDRANRWPKGITGPPPVDFMEDFLFAIDRRFPLQPPVLDSESYAIACSPPAPLPLKPRGPVHRLRHP